MAHCDVCVLARMVPLTDLDHRVDAFFSAQSIRLIDGLNRCIALVDQFEFIGKSLGHLSCRSFQQSRFKNLNPFRLIPHWR